MFYQMSLKTPSPTFGIASGWSTAYGLLPLVTIYAGLALYGYAEISLLWILLSFVVAKLLSEWIFWFRWPLIRELPKRTLRESNLSVQQSSSMRYCGVAILVDSVVDLLLISLAVQAGVSSVLSILCLACSSLVSGWIHGYVVDLTGGKRLIIVDLLISAIAVGVIVRVPWQYAMLTLCLKGLFAQATIPARSKIAQDVFVCTHLESSS